MIGARRRTHLSDGYGATFLGSLVGAIVLGIGATYLGGWWAVEYQDDPGLGFPALALGGLFVGTCVGGALGGFVALRLFRGRRAGTTFAVLLVSWPAALAIAIALELPQQYWRYLYAPIPIVVPLVARRVALIGTPATHGGRHRPQAAVKVKESRPDGGPAP